MLGAPSEVVLILEFPVSRGFVELICAEIRFLSVCLFEQAGHAVAELFAASSREHELFGRSLIALPDYVRRELQLLTPDVVGYRLRLREPVDVCIRIPEPKIGPSFLICGSFLGRCEVLGELERRHVDIAAAAMHHASQ